MWDDDLKMKMAYFVDREIQGWVDDFMGEFNKEDENSNIVDFAQERRKRGLA